MQLKQLGAIIFSNELYHMAISWSSRGSKSGVEKISMGFMVWEGDHKEEFSSYKEDKIGKDLNEN